MQSFSQPPRGDLVLGAAPEDQTIMMMIIMHDHDRAWLRHGRFEKSIPTPIRLSSSEGPNSRLVEFSNCLSIPMNHREELNSNTPISKLVLTSIGFNIVRITANRILLRQGGKVRRLALL
jgi:hypothetical protein